MFTFDHPALSAAGEGRRIKAFGGMDLRIPTATTGGQISVWESVAAPNAGPPLHIHTREDELFYVLSGTFRFWCGEESFVGGPGTSMVLPRNVPHTFKNIGTTEGRVLAAAIPGGFENFFLEVERTGAKAPADLRVIAAKYGLTFVAPAPGAPAEPMRLPGAAGPAVAALSREELAGIASA